jgi:hypothetical protein
MNSKRLGVGISLGICFGAALGASLHDVGLGIALGISLGALASSRYVFGAPDPALARTKSASEKPLPHPLGL